MGWMRRNKKKARQPLVREKVIGKVLVMVDVDNGGYGMERLGHFGEPSNETKNSVTAWVVEELRYAGWEVDPMVIRDHLWSVN